MEKKPILAIISILLMLMTMISPTIIIPITSVKAWEYQDGTPSDTLFEQFGPRADNLLIRLYPSPVTEWDGLTYGEIDVTDWPLTRDYFEQFIQPPYSDNINIIGYGCEFSFYMLDINNNNNSYLGNPPNPAYPNPVYPNPCSVLGFRQAIAYLVNRSYITYDITKGFGIPIWTPMPPSLSTFVHPEIKPGGALESLTYGGWTGDINAASELLWNSGFPIGDDGWRFWHIHPEIYLELKLVIPVDDTYACLVGEFIASQLEAVRIRVNRIYCDEQYAQYLVMGQKDFHLYIGRYVTGSDPTFLSNWNWRYYWHPGKPNNYDGINNPEFNNASDRVRYAYASWDEVINQTWIAQEVFAQNALSVPLFSTYGVKAMSRRYVGWETPYNGNYWEGVVNIHGYGIDNYWSFLNMHPQGCELGDGSMTIRWGLSTPAISSFNPIYASTESEWKILDLIYEPLIRWNPYTFELIPWLAEGFSVGMYNHPVYGECTKVQFTMRPDAYWSDGTPITAYDVYFTLVKLDDILASRGLPPPWWKKNVDNILDFKMLDPYNFEVLFNCTSIWALDWLSEIPILPAHIWEPIAKSGDPTSFAPDPNVIGSGPWRLNEYADWLGYVFLVANKPGSMVQTNLPGSTLVTSPYGYFRYSPVRIDIHNILGKFLPGTYNFNVTITNLCQTSSMDVDVTIEVDKVILWLWTGSIPAGESSVLPVLYNFDLGMHMINVTVYCGLPNLGWAVIKIYTQLVYTTLKEDITGSTFYDDIGIPTYPYKSFLQTPDFQVSLNDLFTVYHALDSYPGHPRWNPIADISCDCVINITDLNLIFSKLFPGQYNIAITKVTTSKTIVCQGYSLNVNVTLENQSSYTENVTLELKFNEYKVKTSSISVNAGTMTTVTLAVIPHSFIFQMISREPGGVPPQGNGSFTINGNGTFLKAKTGSINWGNVLLPGGIIELYKSDGALIKRLELLIPPDGNGIVFTNAAYRDGLYAVGTTVGSVCFLDDNGESGEMSIAETPINGIRIEGTNVTLYTADETILIRRINMEFALIKGQYIISAYAWPVPGEVEVGDNTFSDGFVMVVMVGDLNNDGVIDIRDISIAGRAYGSYPGHSRWNPNADINNDNIIDIRDISTIGRNYGKTDP